MEGRHSRPGKHGLIIGLVLFLAAAVLLTGIGIAAAQKKQALRRQEDAERAAALEEAERVRAEEEKAEAEARAAALQAALDSLSATFIREPEDGCLRIEYARTRWTPGTS